ncbi:MAG TPA: ABC transporter substrate-binding protein [Candidatus Limnocylindrales bacterium]|nr:ABC transporter substrate-binding protein [Candidatus Limnocylindrales bacterium]
MRRLAALACAIVPLLASCGQPAQSGAGSITVGALFPLTGVQAPLARQEYAGVAIARDLVNQDGGVLGQPIRLLTRDLTQREDASARAGELKAAGAIAVLGAYSSALSLPAADAARSQGLLYWEAGAVADQLTGAGNPLVFRVGATGHNLGAMSARFAAEVLAPRLQRAPQSLRMVIVHNTDLYPQDVADAAQAQAAAEGMPVAAVVPYDVRHPDWPAVLVRVRAARPDILVLASYIPDGVAFRQAMLAAGVHVQAMIGSTMAQCVPEFGALMGADAIGVFASDRPTSGFNPGALNVVGRAVYDRFAAAYRLEQGSAPTEEALAGFAAAWTLFHYVMPQAARAHDLTPEGMARVARALDLPDGTLVNGAGVRFSSSPATMGQNLRAASVIWQWQAVRHSVTVYPPVFATGTPGFIPLPR